MWLPFPTHPPASSGRAEAGFFGHRQTARAAHAARTLVRFHNQNSSSDSAFSFRQTRVGAGFPERSGAAGEIQISPWSKRGKRAGPRRVTGTPNSAAVTEKTVRGSPPGQRHELQIAIPGSPRFRPGEQVSVEFLWVSTAFGLHPAATRGSLAMVLAEFCPANREAANKRKRRGIRGRFPGRSRKPTRRFNRRSGVRQFVFRKNLSIHIIEARQMGNHAGSAGSENRHPARRGPLWLF